MYIKHLDLKLPDNIVEDLLQIDWCNLTPTTSFNYKNYLRAAWRAGFLLDLLFHYKLNLSNLGNVKNFTLPQATLKSITHELTKILPQEIVSQAVIRLQVIYGGVGIPVHIDETRYSSIVYPIYHPCRSETRFFSKNIKKLTRGLQNYQNCTIVSSTIVETCPVLLNTDWPHDVFYSKDVYTVNQPRISLTIKFEAITFTELADIL